MGSFGGGICGDDFTLQMSFRAQTLPGICGSINLLIRNYVVWFVVECGESMTKAICCGSREQPAYLELGFGVGTEQEAIRASKE